MIPNLNHFENYTDEENILETQNNRISFSNIDKIRITEQNRNILNTENIQETQNNRISFSNIDKIKISEQNKNISNEDDFKEFIRLKTKK